MTTPDIVIALQTAFETKEQEIAQLRSALEAIKQESRAPYWTGSNARTFGDIANAALNAASARNLIRNG